MNMYRSPAPPAARWGMATLIAVLAMGAVNAGISIWAALAVAIIGFVVAYFSLARSWAVFTSIVLATAIFGTMAMSIMDTPDWRQEGQGLPAEASQLDPIVTGIFEEHVFALEVLGVLLTAAMIGALVIARPLGQAPDSVHYWSDPDHAEHEPEMHEPQIVMGGIAAPIAPIAPVATDIDHPAAGKEEEE